MKANNLENKVDPNHVLWYWQTDLTLADNGGDFVLLWQDPADATNQVVIDAFDYISTDAENEYFDITQPAGTPLNIRQRIIRFLLINGTKQRIIPKVVPLKVISLTIPQRTKFYLL